MFKSKLLNFRQHQIRRMPTSIFLTGLFGLGLYFFFFCIRRTGTEDVFEYNAKLLKNIQETLSAINISNSTFSSSTYKKNVCQYISLTWEWAVDSNGNVCWYDDIDENTNCCLPDRYANVLSNASSCPRCDKKYECCVLYESCIACCLDRTWNTLFLESQKKNNLKLLPDKLLFIQGGLPEDVFGFCVMKCRTNSNSVVHENDFKSNWKYCYGNKSAPLTALSLRKK